MSDETKPAEPVKSTPASGTILLVDDDKFLLDMYAMKFAREGFTVKSCLSTDEAITELHQGGAPDVILFDITMPERDGFSFLEAIAKDASASSSIKIALTNQSSDSERTRAQQFGVDDYFVKATMIPSEVVNKVREILASRHPRA